MLRSNQRFILHFDLAMAPHPSDAPALPLADFIPHLQKRQTDGLSFQVIDNERRVIRLSAVNAIKLSNGAPAVAMLFSLGDRDKADPQQIGLSRYETAFQILHKLRAGMVRQDRDRIGGNLARGDHIEMDETYIGGAVRGEGRGVHADDKTLVIGAVEVRQRPAKKGDKPTRRGGRYAGRLRLEIAPTRGAKSLNAFAESAIEPGATVITDAWGGYNGLGALGYAHLPVVEGSNPEVAEEYLPIIHLVFSNLKAWLQGTHHGAVSPQHLQAYLNEFTFRFNRRFYPFNARSARCSASARTARPRPMTASTAASGSTPRLVVMR
jgi:hypothetical protein